MKKIMLFTTLIFSLSFSQAFANSMINNKAEAYVQGDIIQKTARGSSSTINIGSISQENATNIQVKAYVEGDIIVKTGKNQKTTLNIGSVGGKK